CADEILERAQGLAEVGDVVEPMQVIEVDAIGPEPAQAGLDRTHEVVARAASRVRTRAGREVRLRGEHDVVALAAHETPEDLLGASLVVDVGGVEEVDASVEGGTPDLARRGLVGVTAERHRAERDARDLDPGLAEETEHHRVASSAREGGLDAGEDLLLARR